MLFFKKSEVEKRAEKGDKSAILELLRKGKRDKARKLLERHEEDPDLRKVLFDLYLEEENYMQAYRLLERYGNELGSAEERGLVYEKAGNYTKAVEEYLKVGSFESLYKVGGILSATGQREKALEVLERALKIAPPSKREELEKKIYELKKALGLVEEKKESLLDKLKKGLRKTKESVEFGIVFRGRKVDDELFEELEELLVKADVGVKTAVNLVEDLRKTAIRKNIKSSEELKEITKEKVKELLRGCEGKLNLPTEKKPVVVLFLGVNGSGKTTTIGKLAHRFTKEGKRVLLVAADTFRAAAIEQLEVWAQRSGADITKKHEGADPASVVYEGVDRAIREGHDVVLIDTAGRLHTKEPLIQELRKVKKVIQKLAPEEPSETLLVLDATIGQNSIQQAKVFKEAVDISGIVVTKLDGSAKGGAVIAICRELKIPIKLIGVGEGIDDLQPFSVDEYVDALFD
ncbi:signal recognition particle-docking protein FtsY [Hydrogenivirga sp. 128-5-R1-1]|uniref:signal recognition particle-docking protein FtsY n=1 Tax=Hydrogenivirga sp. 128-5-R1-1 TaxID=392423 RepID=UPI00015F0C76|nr:signal recognition particle-docking protein FtsY [Hydrogenivirga sp. 128-5-R1-1]EDP75816.1 cell division protein FtsY [Hydrogenivirga sp. 128-5-R1-1]